MTEACGPSARQRPLWTAHPPLPVETPPTSSNACAVACSGTCLPRTRRRLSQLLRCDPSALQHEPHRSPAPATLATRTQRRLPNAWSDPTFVVNSDTGAVTIVGAKEQIGSCSFQAKRPASRSRSSDAPPEDDTYVWSTPARTDNALLLQAIGTIAVDLGRPKGFVPLFTTGPYPIDGWLSFGTRYVRLPHHNYFVTTVYYSATR